MDSFTDLSPAKWITPSISFTFLYDVLKTKDKKGVAGEIYNSLHYSLRALLDNAEKKVQSLF